MSTGPIQPVNRPEDINIFSRSFRELIVALTASVAEFERMRNDISVRLALPVRDAGGPGEEGGVPGVLEGQITGLSGGPCYTYNAVSCLRRNLPDGGQEPWVTLENATPVNRTVDCNLVDVTPAPNGRCILIQKCFSGDWDLVCWERIVTTPCPPPEP